MDAKTVDGISACKAGPAKELASARADPRSLRPGARALARPERYEGETWHEQHEPFFDAAGLGR